MNKRLTLSKETLRALDEEQLAMVVGGSGSKDNHGKKGKKGKGHGKTGQHGSCNANSAKSKC